jgi:hypothetical protein
MLYIGYCCYLVQILKTSQVIKELGIKDINKSIGRVTELARHTNSQRQVGEDLVTKLHDTLRSKLSLLCPFGCLFFFWYLRSELVLKISMSENCELFECAILWCL